MSKINGMDEETAIAIRQQAIYGIPERDFQAWKAQRQSAKLRGIPFKFSLLTWSLWWKEALAALEPDAKRGRRRDNYVMARRGDQGAYEPENVYAARPITNANDIPVDKRAVAIEKRRATRIANGKPLGQHLKVRGDLHPRSIPVRTPDGWFGSIALAAEHYGLTRAGGHYRLKSGEWRRG